MKNITFRTPVKATVAAVVGVALLAGVGGSFAYWSATETIDSSGTITQGRLGLASTEGGQWESSLNPGVAVADVDAYRVVPGEILTFTDTVTLTAEGDQLDATLTTNAANVTGEAVANGSLIVDQQISDAADPAAAFGQAVSVDAGDDGRQFGVEVTVEFPTDATAQGLSVTLSGIEATVNQNQADAGV